MKKKQIRCIKCGQFVKLETWEKDQKVYGWFCHKCGRPIEKKYFHRLKEIEEHRLPIIMDFEIKRSINP